MSFLRIATTLFIACLLICDARIEARAQSIVPSVSDETARGITLYQQGNHKEAIKVLREAVKQHKNDAKAWYYLGLAFNQQNDTSAARKALEQAVKLKSDFAPSHTALAYILLLADKSDEASKEIERALAINPRDPKAHYVKSQTQVALFIKGHAKAGKNGEGTYVRLKEAADSLEKALQLNPPATEAAAWREALEALRLYAGLGDKSNSEGSLSWAKDTVKPTLLYKEKAKYTEEARHAGVHGTVILLAIFTAEGEIKHILPLKGLSHGLTEQAIRAALKIKFQPAMKDGHPVSVAATLEFNFALY